MRSSNAPCERVFAPRTMCMDDLDQLMQLSAMSSGTIDSEEEESDDEDDDQDWDAESNPSGETSEMEASEDDDGNSVCTEQGSLPDLRDDDLFDCVHQQASDTGFDGCSEFALQEQHQLGNGLKEHKYRDLKKALVSTDRDRRSVVAVCQCVTDISIALLDNAKEDGHNSESKSSDCSSQVDFVEQSEHLHRDLDSLRASAEHTIHGRQQFAKRPEACNDLGTGIFSGSAYRSCRSVDEVGPCDPAFSIRSHNNSTEVGCDFEGERAVCSSLEKSSWKGGCMHLDSDSLRASCAELAAHGQQRIRDGLEDSSDHYTEEDLVLTDRNRTSAIAVGPCDLEMSVQSHDSASEDEIKFERTRGDSYSLEDFFQRGGQIHVDSELSDGGAELAVHDLQRPGNRFDEFHDPYVEQASDSTDHGPRSAYDGGVCKLDVSSRLHDDATQAEHGCEGSRGESCDCSSQQQVCQHPEHIHLQPDSSRASASVSDGFGALCRTVRGCAQTCFAISAAHVLLPPPFLLPMHVRMPSS